MISVNENTFFKTIRSLDIVIEVVGNYPYTSIFKTRRNVEIVGKIVDHEIGNESDFYINQKLEERSQNENNLLS